jgi:hypothetical protein
MHHDAPEEGTECGFPSMQGWRKLPPSQTRPRLRSSNGFISKRQPFSYIMHVNAGDVAGHMSSSTTRAHVVHT